MMHARAIISSLLTALMIVLPIPAHGQDWYSPVLPDEPVVATAPRFGHTVALFYFLWSCESGETATRGPTDVSRILANRPQAARDPHDPAWDNSYYGTPGVEAAPNHHYLYWGKPNLGYYCSADPWVIARHVRMLTAAGIDMLVLDATNALIYENVVDEVIEQLRDATGQGMVTPKLVFYTNSDSGQTMDRIWRTYYDPASAKYAPDVAFELDGKPLIIGRGSEASALVRKAMTIRESQWPNEPLRDCGWPWMEFVRPQPVHRCHGRAEIVNVSVAQHAETVKMSSWPFQGLDRNWGRGFHDGRSDHSWRAISSGANFEEQWSVALAADPPFVFVTGWNEWIAARFLTKEGGQFMVDLATPEFSRDLEPMAGGWGDAYYRQLVRNVRRYKGAPPSPRLSCMAAGGQSRRSSGVRFKDYRGDIKDRDFAGAGGRRLVDRSGRNDIVEADIVCSDQGLRFSAHTAESLTGEVADDWMRLDFAVEWRGTGLISEYRVRMRHADGRLHADLFRMDRDNTWVPQGELEVRRGDDVVSVELPFDRIGSRRSVGAVRMKWYDHVGELDPMAVYSRGDTAPAAIMQYRAVVGE